MTIARGPRLQAAEAMLARFVAAGRLPAGTLDAGGGRAAALAQSPDDEAGSVTYPRMMRRWFTAAGCSIRADTMGIGLQASSIAQTLKLMTHWANSWIVLQIDASLIANGEIGFYTNRHWVVVSPHHQPLVRLGPKGRVVSMGDAFAQSEHDRYKRLGSFGAAIDETPDPLEWQTSLHLVSWGEEEKAIRNPTLKFLDRRIYGGYAFSRMH